MEQQCSPWNTYNITSEQYAEAWLYTNVDTFNVLAMIPIIFTFGVFTTLAFLLSVLRLQRMHTVTNFYLSALAVCDILLLSTAPIIIVSYFQTVGYRFTIMKNRFHCILLFTSATIGYYTSVAIVSLVSSERFYALCYPLRHKAIAGKTRTLKLIIGAVGFGLICAAINVPSYAVFSTFCVIWPDQDRFADMPSVGGRCGPVSFTYYIYHEMFTILLFVAAFLYNSCLYIRIIVVLNKRSFGTESSSNLQVDHIRKQVARVLIMNGLVFFFCQSPYRITALNRVTSAIFHWSFLSQSQSDNIDIAGRVMLFLNSAINPTLYSLGSSFYRKAIIEAVGCSRRGVKSNKSTSAGTSPSYKIDT